jgi:3-oxoacyl-(acyl-carrier-protein) synthase
LKGLFGEGDAGRANPFLFSESVASAPAGHGSIQLELRGANVTFTCGDASAAAALAAGVRAVESGRVDLAYCGGVELLPAPLPDVLAALGAPPFVGEGCVSLVLEDGDRARARRAKIYAEVAALAAGSDSACGRTEWSANAERIAAVLGRAVQSFGQEEIERVFLHASGSRGADEAEAQAAAHVVPGARRTSVSGVFGSLAAAGGFNLAAAALERSERPHAKGAAVLSSAWGGTLQATILRAPAV